MHRRLILFAALLALVGCDRFGLETEDGRTTYTSGEVVTIYANYKGQRADETALSQGWIEWSGAGQELGTGPELMTSQLPPGRHRIRAKFIASSGEVLAEDSIRIKVENQAPRAEILSVSFVEGGAMFLSGAAPDHEDGHVKPSQMVWYVDEKEVGRGERVTVHGIAPGSRHEVRLTATDSNRMLTGVMDIVHAPETPGAQPPSLHVSTPAGDGSPNPAPTAGLIGVLDNAGQ